MKSSEDTGTTRQMPVNLRYILLFLLAVCVLAGFWAFYLFPLKGYQEMIVSSGQTVFTADFAHINAVIPCNNNVELGQLLDDEPVSVSVQIYSVNGDKTAEISEDGSYIHTNSYISTDQFVEEGVPFDLVPGGNYIIRYQASCGSVRLDDLSFSFCGEYSRILRITGTAAMLCMFSGILLMAGTIIRGRKKFGKRLKTTEILTCSLIWMMTSGVFLISAPETIQSEEERTSFSNAYAISSVLLDRPCADGEGNVYIEEEGIRNLGNLSYSVPLNRFWNNWRYGSSRTANKTSTLFQTDLKLVGNGSDDTDIVSDYSDYQVQVCSGGLVTLINSLAVSAARVLRLPYQLIYLSGPVLNAIVVLLLYILCLQTAAGTAVEQEIVLIFMIFMMPSVIQGSFSYQGTGVRIALGTLWGLMCLRKERACIERATIQLYLIAVLLLLVAPYYLVMGMAIKYRKYRRNLFGILSALCGVAVEFVILLIRSNPDTIEAAFNCITAGSSDLFSSIAGGYYNGSRNVQLNIYFLIVVFILMWILFQKPAAEKRSHGDLTGNGTMADPEFSEFASSGWKMEWTSLTVLFVCDLLYIMSGIVDYRNRSFPIMAGVTGAGFLPFSLIPLFCRNRNRKGNEKSVSRPDDPLYVADDTDVGNAGGNDENKCLNAVMLVSGGFLIVVLLYGLKCIS